MTVSVRETTRHSYPPRLRTLTVAHVEELSTTMTPGARLGVLGPRGYTIYPDGYARYVLGADQTALPTLERWIDEAPHDATIDAVVLAPAEAHRDLPDQPGLTVQWIHDIAGTQLISALIAATETNDEQTYVWAAAESGIVAPLRRHLTAADYPRTAFDVTGYWRLGHAGSGGHHTARGHA